MSARARAAAALLAAALLSSGAAAQERPDEDALFGGGEEERAPSPSAAPPKPSADVPAQPPGVGAPGEARTREEQLLEGPAAQSGFDTEALTDDPLKLGGQLYLRAFSQGQEGVTFGDTRLSTPTLVDVYLDARPTGRLRGMVVGRLTFDPSAPDGVALDLDTPGLPGLLPGQGDNPAVLLDQAWLRFDIAHTVFVTVGKQHVKWGTSRFWNPTDFLSPARRDPLAVFDARTGASMLKLHLPWEARGWNLYAIGLLDNAGPASTLGQVGGALRAEAVFGSAEVGVSAVAQRGRKARFGLDVSSGLGPVDVYGELALRRGTDVPFFRLPEGVDPDTLFTSGPITVEEVFPGSLTPQVSGGATYTLAYTESDTVTLGAEYFYNAAGYGTSVVYPYLLFRGRFEPFYVGEHYGALYALLAGPGRWDKTSFILSNLGNLSDRSFTSRLDVLHTALSYLSVEAFAAVSYGRKGGEFRLGVDVPSTVINGQPLPAVSVPAPTVQVGVGLRISI